MQHKKFTKDYMRLKSYLDIKESLTENHINGIIKIMETLLIKLLPNNYIEELVNTFILFKILLNLPQLIPGLVKEFSKFYAMIIKTYRFKVPQIYGDDHKALHNIMKETFYRMAAMDPKNSFIQEALVTILYDFAKEYPSSSKSFRYALKTTQEYTYKLSDEAKLDALFSSPHIMKMTFVAQYIPKIGDYNLQFDIVRFIYTSIPRERIDDFCYVIFRTTQSSHGFKRLKEANFRGDCRRFLNDLNTSIEERSVYSFECMSVSLGRGAYFAKGEREIVSIYMDFNTITKSINIQIYRMDSYQSENIMIFISQIEKIKIPKWRPLINFYLKYTSNAADNPERPKGEMAMYLMYNDAFQGIVERMFNCKIKNLYNPFTLDISLKNSTIPRNNSSGKDVAQKQESNSLKSTLEKLPNGANLGNLTRPSMISPPPSMSPIFRRTGIPQNGSFKQDYERSNFLEVLRCSKPDWHFHEETLRLLNSKKTQNDTSLTQTVPANNDRCTGVRDKIDLSNKTTKSKDCEKMAEEIKIVSTSSDSSSRCDVIVVKSVTPKPVSNLPPSLNTRSKVREEKGNPLKRKTHLDPKEGNMAQRKRGRKCIEMSEISPILNPKGVVIEEKSPIYNKITMPQQDQTSVSNKVYKPHPNPLYSSTPKDSGRSTKYATVLKSSSGANNTHSSLVDNKKQGEKVVAPPGKDNHNNNYKPEICIRAGKVFCSTYIRRVKDDIVKTKVCPTLSTGKKDLQSESINKGDGDPLRSNVTIMESGVVEQCKNNIYDFSLDSDDSFITDGKSNNITNGAPIASSYHGTRRTKETVNISSGVKDKMVNGVAMKESLTDKSDKGSHPLVPKVARANEKANVPSLKQLANLFIEEKGIPRNFPAEGIAYKLIEIVRTKKLTEPLKTNECHNSLSIVEGPNMKCNRDGSFKIVPSGSRNTMLEPEPNNDDKSQAKLKIQLPHTISKAPSSTYQIASVNIEKSSDVSNDQDKSASTSSVPENTLVGGISTCPQAHENKKIFLLVTKILKEQKEFENDRGNMKLIYQQIKTALSHLQEVYSHNFKTRHDRLCKLTDELSDYMSHLKRQRDSGPLLMDDINQEFGGLLSHFDRKINGLMMEHTMENLKQIFTIK